MHSRRYTFFFRIYLVWTSLNTIRDPAVISSGKSGILPDKTDFRSTSDLRSSADSYPLVTRRYLRKSAWSNSFISGDYPRSRPQHHSIPPRWSYSILEKSLKSICTTPHNYIVMFFFDATGECPRCPPIWKLTLMDLRIECWIMLTIIIVYSIGHNIVKTTTSISKIANASSAF